MNRLEKALMKQWGAERLQKIQEIKIGIGGAGGLGSNCAVNLVRTGFKKFWIVDFDLVEDSNLNRQFYFTDQVGMAKVEALKRNLLRINPGLEIKIQQCRINRGNIAEIFNDCHAIVEAFDRAEEKKRFIEHWMGSGKFIVSASGIAGYGHSDQLITHRFRDDLYVVGDLVSEVGSGMPPLSPRVNIAAAKQADIILEWALKEQRNE